MQIFPTPRHPYKVAVAGFSLIELLVALSIFTIVITMAVGTLLVLIDANGKAQNIQTTMTNLNFALDSMTREIRTGNNYICLTRTGLPSTVQSETATPVDCSSGNFLSIIEGGSSLTAGSGSSRIEYMLHDNSLYRRVGDATEPWLAITSSDITIETLEFVVSGSRSYNDSANEEQPLVSIFIAGEAGELEAVDTSFELQTTVAQRLLDV